MRFCNMLPTMRPTTSATHERAVLRLARRRGLLRTSDIVALGVPTVVLTRLARAGKLERTGRGVYTLAGRAGSAHRSLAEVSLRAPRGVICLISALRVHEIGTQAPFAVWLALPAGVLPPRLVTPEIRVVRMSLESLTAGVDTLKV